MRLKRLHSGLYRIRGTNIVLCRGRYECMDGFGEWNGKMRTLWEIGRVPRFSDDSRVTVTMDNEGIFATRKQCLEAAIEILKTRRTR